MGLKKFFKLKPPEEATAEQNREYLNELGIATKTDNKRREKFAAYGKFANDKVKKTFYAPKGYESYGQPKEDQEELDDLNNSPYDQASMVNDRKNYNGPYESTPSNAYSGSTAAAYGSGAQGSYASPYPDSSSPYGDTSSPYGENTASPYADSSNAYTTSTNGYVHSLNVYGQSANQPPRAAAAGGYNNGGMRSNRGVENSPMQQSSNPYGGTKISRGVDNQPLQQPANPYGSMSASAYETPTGSTAPASNPYAAMSKDTYSYSDSGISSIKSSYGQPPPQKTQYKDDSFNFEESRHDDELDLNETIGNRDEEDDLNNSIHETQNVKGFQTFEDMQQQHETQERQEEDAEVDEIKQQIRFTKQSSVASTRNTLKMAQDAEVAGMNTLGMLGHQSEKLNNVERNLNLMQIQNRVADDKVSELKKLNRNILAVHVSNPFHSKRRAREAEDRIKMQRIQDRQLQEEISSNLHQSTQRIEHAMNATSSEVRDRYQRQQIMERAKRFQFENDEEDDEMEMEIDRNLDKIGQISGRLKKLAIATGNEIDSQQERIKGIEEDTDDLDIKIHVNTTKLTNIR